MLFVDKAFLACLRMASWLDNHQSIQLIPNDALIKSKPSLKRFLVGPLLTEMESMYDVEIRSASKGFDTLNRPLLPITISICRYGLRFTSAVRFLTGRMQPEPWQWNQRVLSESSGKADYA